ncbi:MAG TPA: hypothetical protein VGO91_05255 [Pyrinomonadaceae bacterium]|nr:hypothetical protein [Pyrinomonadaceae bacterium]
MKIPKIPKPDQPQTQPTQTNDSQPTQPQPESRNETKTAAASGEDQPTIAKDSVQVKAFTNNFYHKNFDTWSWFPQIEYRVNGPIASGSQLYVEFTLPGSGPWVKFDCKTEETQAGYWLKTECGARDIPEDKSTTYTGPVNFAIHMRNELAGTDSTLFNGKIKVGKAHSNEQGPKAVNKFVYYVDDDWNLPIGYVFYTADSTRGMDRPVFNLAFWVRGEAVNFEPHLFYQGKEVGKMFYQGEEVGKASCEAEVENATTHYVDDSVPQKAKWSRVICSFVNVRGWDKTGEQPGMFGPLYLLSANPGDYEFKLLWNNHLARSIKFTAGSGGKLDNGIASANKLGNNRVIVPVQIMGDQDGQWDRTAWKTDAFYGNPLTGFTASQ